MTDGKHWWANGIAEIASNKPWIILLTALVLTIISIVLAEGLEMRMNWSDILPEGDPVVRSFREVQERFGNPAGLVVALEGDYNSIRMMADTLEPRLRAFESLYNVQGKLPTEFIRNNGFKLQKPNEFDRMLKIYSDPSLIGYFKGLNDDFETEYSDNESNMRRDEVNIARNMLGIHRGLEVLLDNLNPPRFTEGE